MTGQTIKLRQDAHKRAMKLMAEERQRQVKRAQYEAKVIALAGLAMLTIGLFALYGESLARQIINLF